RAGAHARARADARAGACAAIGAGGVTRLVHEHLVETAARTPDRPALVVGEATHTFAEIDRASDGLAATLQAAGVRRGDRVAIMADNSAEVVVALFAVLKAGGVFVIVNPTTKAPALTHVLTDCTVTALVAHGRMARVALPALAEAPSVTASVWIGTVPEGAPAPVAYDEAVATTTPVTDPGVIDLDLASLIYTSGSTGRPKGVMLTHANVTHNMWSIGTYLGHAPDDVVACLLPLSFGYGLFQVLVGARIGYTTVIEPSFAYPVEVLRRLAARRVTALPAVPTVLATILQLLPLDGVDLSSLALITTAAAALPPAHIARLRAAFPQARIVSMYGQTECTRISYLDPDRIDEKPTSVGKAIPNTEAYVVDEAGGRVGPGVVGELVVRGANVMRGYWGDPVRTALRLRDGDIPGEKVLHTGDQFRTDEDGFLYFVGRTDDVFKCKGEKISPKEIEDVLYEMEAVAEAAVVGVPDEIDGTAIKAIVTAREGAEVTVEAVRRHCRGRLVNYMVPKHVEVRATLPKTASGKIRRAALVDS
ncbi:MAG TPA: AMP-binding protein, partial [Acidimicrobiales bacterium]